ncbi:MAG: glycoside hydrolase family 31 protein [Rhodoferax sp.]|nr:glycoside hydrolase family 31 protein [Rhodoferax sp.]
MNPLAAATIDALHAQGVRLALADGGQVQLDFLSPTMARLRHRGPQGYREPRTWAIAPVPGQDVPWAGRPRDDLSGFESPPLTVEPNASGLRLDSGALSVQVRTGTLALTWRDGQGRPLAADRPTSAYLASRRTGAVRHYLQRDRAERYYGLGDKTGPLDLHGRRLRTLALDSLGYDPACGDPLYKHWPFVLCRAASGHWYGLYYDTLCACTFDLGCEHDNYHGLYRHVEIDDGDLDYYFMAGSTPGAVIAQFVRLIGGTALPPRWTLGYAQTAMGLADAPDAQDRLNDFMDRMAAEGIPCSAFHYGSGYSSRGKRRYVFTWNRDKFPDPKALNARFQAQGLRVVANVKPCLLDDHPDYAQVSEQQGFIQDAGTGTPVIEPFWDGVGSHLDFTRPAAVRWWQDSLRRQVLDYGIDVAWNDNNEYAVLDDNAVCHGFGEPLALHRARPLHALLMTRASCEAQALHQPHEPVFSVSRGGMPGIQRHAQTWTGDNTTSWETLRWNIRTGLQMSLSGLFNVGHDVGGFAGPVPDAELFVRWVQACCLNPRMVMNSWKADGTVNLPWLHPGVTPLVAAAIRLRYRLLPYLWRLFERASREHQPILRPLFFEFPEDPASYADSDDFMLGDALLVAPVVVAGERRRSVYLPAGPAAWFDFETGQRYAAGQRHEVDAPLDRLPLFARAGAEVPLAQGQDGRHRHDDPVSEWRRFDPA